MKLLEVLNKPVPYEWTRRDKMFWQGKFYVADKKYLFHALAGLFQGPNEWEIMFTMTDKNGKSGLGTMEPTGKGNEFKIFATVAKMTDDFIKKQKPKSFIFSAKEKSRRKLYDRFAKKISSAYGYKLSTGTKGSHLVYNFDKKK